MRAVPVPLALLMLLGACDGDASKSSDGAAPSKPEDAKPDADGPKGAFSKYKARSMASEAMVTIRRIADGASVYAMEERVDPADPMTVKTGPPPAAPMTPAAGSCCKEPEGTCAPDKGNWDHEGWKAVNFEPDHPHRYSYEVEVKGQTVTVRAVGDLDCDGILSTYESVGTMKDGMLEFTRELAETNPLE